MLTIGSNFLTTLRESINMRKFVLPLALAAASASLSAPVIAQQAAATPPPPPVTGNITLASEYRFRGIDQTYGNPAIQGGFDYAHASGLYAGNWNSNVSQGAGFPGGNIEMDFYGCYKRAFGDLGLDVGFIYYYYPGTKAGATTPFSPVNNKTGEVHSGKVDNKEIYIGGSGEWGSLQLCGAIDDTFSNPGTQKTYYGGLSADYEMRDHWGGKRHMR